MQLIDNKTNTVNQVNQYIEATIAWYVQVHTGMADGRKAILEIIEYNKSEQFPLRSTQTGINEFDSEVDSLHMDTVRKLGIKQAIESVTNYRSYSTASANACLADLMAKNQAYLEGLGAGRDFLAIAIAKLSSSGDITEFKATLQSKLDKLYIEQKPDSSVELLTYTDAMIHLVSDSLYLAS